MLQHLRSLYSIHAWRISHIHTIVKVLSGGERRGVALRRGFRFRRFLSGRQVRDDPMKSGEPADSDLAANRVLIRA
jgi:hypothetical protein